MVLAFILAATFGVATYRYRWLTAGGAIVASGFAFTLVGFAGPAWYVPGVTFFVLASLLSRIGRRKKAALEDRLEKGSVRDATQVLANGGVAWGMLACGLWIYPSPLCYWGYLGAFAAAASDTWATEVGTLSRATPRLITTGKPVERGTSGGVTVVGSLAAIAGALFIALAAAPFLRHDLGSSVLLVTGVGTLSSMVDSLLGATAQARFRDPKTGRVTERRRSDRRHERVGGYARVNNDVVNLICTLFGAFFAMVLARLFLL